MDDDAIKIMAKAVEQWRDGRGVDALKGVYGQTVELHGFACRIVPRPFVFGEPFRVDVEMVREGRAIHRVCVEIPDDRLATMH